MLSEASIPKFLFESAADAQRAFYEAFQHCDLEDMMSVWADDRNIVCVHPGGPRVCGPEAIRESWENIFKELADWDLRLSDGQCVEDELLSVHQVQENIYREGKIQAIVIATNLFHCTDQGWRMIMHHASPAPETAADIIAGGRSLH